MIIAIVGHGKVGGTLAQRWANRGHSVIVGTRKPANDRLDRLTKHPGISSLPIPEAIRKAEVILVATPPHVARELVETFGDIGGKILVDATNCVRSKPEDYPTAYHVFEDLTRAEVVKCFNSTGYENMDDPRYGEVSLDMFMAGSSTIAKKAASELAVDCGFDHCYDFGGSDQVELLEKLALAWINLAVIQGHGRHSGFKFLQK